MTDGGTEYNQLRDLLLSPEVAALHGLGTELEDLRHQLENPERATKLLAPVVAAVFRSGTPGLQHALVKAITPFLDQALSDRISQDPDAMAAALAPASTGAIARHFASEPHAAALDLGPLVGAAIKDQLKGERDAMIDALYPVMGSTISKYLSHTLATLVQTINERIEANLSFKSLTRKFRARMLGVSEAELILREAVTWTIDAAFLIHKPSGLVIAQAQNPASPMLDPDLLSGMLTAIRSLFNDSMTAEQQPRELDQIGYGDAKIVLEVAGYCYLAVVVRGTPRERLQKVLHTTMTEILEESDGLLERFSGDTASVPARVLQSVETLVSRSNERPLAPGTRRPYGAAIFASLLLLLAAILIGIHLYRDSRDRNLEETIRTALHAAKPLALAGVSVQAEWGVVQLEGRTINEFQRTRAEAIARTSAHDAVIVNSITPDAGPSFPVFTALRVDEITRILNRVEGVFLETRNTGPDLSVTGWIADDELRGKVDAMLGAIPGVRTYTNASAIGVPELPVRLHFALGSSVIQPADRKHCAGVRDYLRRFPGTVIRITGHSDLTGTEEVNRRLATARARAAQDLLASLGIPRTRLNAQGSPEPPPGAIRSGADSLSRCVRFTLIQERNSLLP